MDNVFLAIMIVSLAAIVLTVFAGGLELFVELFSRGRVDSRYKKSAIWCWMLGLLLTAIPFVCFLVFPVTSGFSGIWLAYYSPVPAIPFFMYSVFMKRHKDYVTSRVS